MLMIYSHRASMEAFGMTPIIKEGDIMLVDMSESVMRGPAIYAAIVSEPPRQNR